jgi:hypothetical protein
MQVTTAVLSVVEHTAPVLQACYLLVGHHGLARVPDFTGGTGCTILRAQ